MYNVSSSYLNAVRESSRSFSTMVQINDNMFYDENIIEFKFVESTNMEEDFNLGSVVSSKLELTLIGLGNTNVQDATIKPYIGLEVGGVIEYVPLGIFYVDDVENNRDIIRVYCFDGMVKLEQSYNSSLRYPAKLSEIALEIASLSGVNLESTLPDVEVSRLDDLTRRDVISYIASYIGGFARFNREGNLEIKTYGSVISSEINSYNYFDLKTQERTYSIGQMLCKAGVKTLRVGTGGNRVSFENPWMTQSQLEAIFHNLQQISYLPYTMSWQGNPALEAGDRIKIIDLVGNEYINIIMDQTITYKGGVRSTIASKANTKTRGEFNYKGSIGKQLDGLIDIPQYVDTMLDLIEIVKEVDTDSLGVGQKVITSGYFLEGDGGGAEYVISDEELPWSIYLRNGRYANIINTDYVGYRMFGAFLDGLEDDTEAIKKCHRYADSVYHWDSNRCKVFTCTVRNNQGIIHVMEPIYCSSNVDLSGSTILMDDRNSNWFGAYVWGENSKEYYSFTSNPELKKSMKEGAFRLEGLSLPENTVLHMEETHYEIRDDDGYLYDVNKGELMVHQQGGLFSTSLGSDWSTAGGTLVYSETTEDFLTTELILQYTYLPTQHRTFTGCMVIFEGSADNYASTIWVKGHNCTVKDFTFYPKNEVLSNTRFKNSMIYVWGSYKVTIRNCNGFNASGKVTPEVPTPTSGYAIRAYQACDLYIDDCSIVGIWGSISVSSTKNCYLNRVTCNRIDVHDYIVNMFVTGCIVYSHSLQIGSGSGVLSVRDTVFYHQYIPEERYPGSYLIALQAGYGRVFSGKIDILNCKYVYLTKNNAMNFYFVKVNFSPHSRSIERRFKFPEVTIRDFKFDTIIPDNMFLSVLNAGGQIKSTTSLTPPPVSNHVAYSGDTKWNTVQHTKDWTDGGYYLEREIIRKSSRELDSSGKIQFYNIQYYLVLTTGRYYYSSTGDTPSGLRRIYAPYYLPGAEYNTVEGTNFVVALNSKFFSEEVFSGNIGIKTKGNYPTHTSGIEWVGDSDGQEGMFLEFLESDLVAVEWEPKMPVTVGQIFTIDTKVFEVTKSGVTSEKVLGSVEWLTEVYFGTAKVRYVGSLWVPGTWLPEGGVALVYMVPGYNGSDFTYRKYKVVQRDGRVLGDNLLSASGVLLDGGIIWDRTNKTPKGVWKPDTTYEIGQVISIEGISHEVAYVQELEMPKRLTLNNIVHSSNYNPFIFSFAPDTYVPTKNQLKVVVDTADEIKGISYMERPFFGLVSNLEPIVVEAEINGYRDDMSQLQDYINRLNLIINDLSTRVEALEAGEEVIYKVFNFIAGVNRWQIQNVNRATNIEIGKLEIINNNAFDVYYILYESYGHGSFAWSELLNIRINSGESVTEYLKLSGTRNDFVCQTRDLGSTLINAPDSELKIVFSNITNTQTPTIICP